MSLKAKLEAVIYAAEEPVTLAQFAALFTADALEWKAEQAAAFAVQAAEQAAQVPAGEEPLPLLIQELTYPEPDQANTSAMPGLLVEPEKSDPTESSPDPNLELNPDSSPETATDSTSDAEATAAVELELRRQARQRDREVRAVIRQLLDDLITTYASDDRGVEIREIAGGYRMATKPECHDAVRCFVKSLKPALKLSLPALETLAVVAYKQPVTAPEVNEIRGVDSSGVFGSLLARKLITTAGRKPVIGRPILYKTTREFLLRFGLKDVAELPSMEEFEKMAAIELDEPELSSSEEATPSRTADLNLELDESADEPEDESPSTALESPETTETAETAVSNEPPIPQKAEPAAPEAQEQAETENPPDGDEETQ